MDKLRLGSQGSSCIGFGYGIRDSLEVVVVVVVVLVVLVLVLVVGVVSVVAVVVIFLHNCYLKFTTLGCTMWCRRYLYQHIVRHIISYARYIANTAH